MGIDCAVLDRASNGSCAHAYCMPLTESGVVTGVFDADFVALACASNLFGGFKSVPGDINELSLIPLEANSKVYEHFTQAAYVY